MSSSAQGSSPSPTREKIATGETDSPSKLNKSKSTQSAALPAKDPIYVRLQKQWVTKTGVDWPTYKQLFKSAIAPTIAIAAYQATPWANFFTTIGYLIGVGAIVSTVVMPRAKFLQTMFLNVLLTCFGAAVAELALFCVISARLNTEVRPGNGPNSGIAAGDSHTVAYNSSASAVAAIWLLVQIFAISALRAARPQFTVPCIMWAIFTNVSMIYAPQFASMAAAQAFLRRLLLALLSGFGIGTGVSLFIMPLTCRSLVKKQFITYTKALQSALEAKMAYIHSLESIDMYAVQRVNTAGEKLPNSPEAEEVKTKTRALAAVHAKLFTDLPFAKREIAVGKIGPDDLQQIFKLLRWIMIPTVGLSQLSALFQRIAEARGWDTAVDRHASVVADVEDGEDKIRIQSMQEYHDLMIAVREPFSQIVKVTSEGLQHALIQLQLTPKPKSVDSEQQGDEPRPGDHNFALFMNRNIADFTTSKVILLRRWAEVHGIELADDFFEHPSTAEMKGPDWMKQTFNSDEQGRYRRQLYVCLYMEFLLYSIAKRTLDFVNYAEELKASGKLDKKHLIVPGYKRLRKWIMSTFRNVEDSHESENMGMNDSNMNVYLGEAFRRRRDPAHLPPANMWERSTDKLRIVARFFASPAAAFGYRVCCATMSIAVVNFLRDTQVFYTRERIFWAQIMISISMQPSAGQGLRNFLFRIGATAVAMLLSWIAWYIVDGHPAGVIVFFWLFLHLPAYIILKRPQWMTMGMVGQMTMNIILGYELQVQKVGRAVATSNGQEFQPTYKLGAIRLAAVCTGLFLAWIWTVFPYPISEHMQIREKMGSALYLMANFYSIMHETVHMRLRGAEGDMGSKTSPGRKMEKSRIKVFSKATLLVESLRAQIAFVKYDIPIGGKFPKERYECILTSLQNVLRGMQLVSYASTTFSELQNSSRWDTNKEWLLNFQKVVGETGVTSHAITSLLALLSSSVSSSLPLPPYMRVPEPYLLSQRLDELDHNLLSFRHVAEPGYASFAVMQIATRTIIDDLKKLLDAVKELVGELDFSYHIVSTEDSSHYQSEETLTYSKTQQDSAPDQKKKPD